MHCQCHSGIALYSCSTPRTGGCCAMFFCTQCTEPIYCLEEQPASDPSPDQPLVYTFAQLRNGMWRGPSRAVCNPLNPMPLLCSPSKASLQPPMSRLCTLASHGHLWSQVNTLLQGDTETLRSCFNHRPRTQWYRAQPRKTCQR